MSYFDEKSAEISVEEMSSFGVRVHTRYGKAWQMAEMLQFTSDLAELDLHAYLSKVFYDSKNDTCYFELTKDSLSPDVSNAILQCALKRISQFEWNDCICHGGALAVA